MIPTPLPAGRKPKAIDEERNVSEIPDIQSRVAEINAKIKSELLHDRLSDATAKAIVVVWMGAAVFFGFMLSESQFKNQDQIAQEQYHANRN